MAFSLSFTRYSCFALFTLCNAVNCCVSVWNLVLAQELGWNPLIDIYLIAISAFGLLYIFPVLFIDLLRKNTYMGRVWFECIWVGVFWILELAGAATVTATLPNMSCNFAAQLFTPGSCTTAKVLEAFTWIGTVNLLAYFCILMISAIMHTKDDPTIWGANTRTYPWYKVREQLNSTQSSPVRATWAKHPVPSAAPQIRLPSNFSDRMVASGTLKNSAIQSSTMKSSAFHSSAFDNEKLSAIPKGTPMTAARSANKSAIILQSAWISATVTPASPPSDGSSDYDSHSGSGSDLTSTPTGIPSSALYVPFSSTIKPSPLGSGAAPPRSSSLSATYAPGQLPHTALRPGNLPSAAAPPSDPRQNVPSLGPRKSKRKSNRPPPLDMTRLHSAYGR